LAVVTSNFTVQGFKKLKTEIQSYINA